MPSIVDIPSHLLTIINKEAFLAWLKKLPCETWIRRSLARSWAVHVGDRLSDQDYNKAGLQMPLKYAHLLPIDIEVWEQYLAVHAPDYELLEYDVRVGLGRDPGSDYEKNIRQMALDLSLRRIDCVAHTDREIVVIEVTHSAGFKALGQITGYPVLYALTFPPLLPIKPLLVCGELQSDIQPIIDSLKIPYVIV